LANATVDGADGSKGHPAELVRAGARAYNRWLADFCSSDPNRLRGITILGTMDDVVWVVDEIVRAYESGLQTGIMLPLDYYLPLYHHPRYDIVWQTCQELNLSVITHVSRGHPHYLGEDPWVQRFMYGQEANWYAQRPIWCMIMGGTLERFPDLRLVITELGVNWVAPLLGGLDASFNMWPKMQASRDVPRRVNFTMTPSEYFQRQCYVAHTTNQLRAEFEAGAYEGVPNMVFGMDVGHNEGWWPVFGFPEPVPEGNMTHPGPAQSIEDAIKSIWGGLPASAMLPYLQDNFFKAYPMIDRAALQDVVDRIGPTAEGIGLT
jgi:predicted TIM-barrel fold metal-dependent hydrolase